MEQNTRNVNIKICRKCNNEKPINDFYKNSKKSDGLDFYCKSCRVSQVMASQSKNPDNLAIHQKNWYIKNKKKSYEKTKKYIKEKLKTNPEFKLRHTLRTRLNDLFKPKRKAGSAVKDLGCSISELKTYLESKFEPGMTWDNHGKDGWHIDHIRPLASFDLTDRAEFLIACHFSNLQPLWAIDNMKKGSKF